VHFHIVIGGPGAPKRVSCANGAASIRLSFQANQSTGHSVGIRVVARGPGGKSVKNFAVTEAALLPTAAQAQTLADEPSSTCEPDLGCEVVSFGPCILVAETLSTSGPPGGPSSYTTAPDITCLYLTNTTNTDTSSNRPPSGGGEVDLEMISVELATGSDTPEIDGSGGPFAYLLGGFDPALSNSCSFGGIWGNDPQTFVGPPVATEASAEAEGTQQEGLCETATAQAATGSNGSITLDSGWTANPI
jgi:hypothetical protein